MAGNQSPANGHVSTSEAPIVDHGEAHSTDGAAGAHSDGLGSEFARLTARVVGRAREEAEDILAEAQSLRQEEPSVGRRTAVYGLAGLLKAGDSIAARARDVAAQARAVQASARAASARSDDVVGSQDDLGSQPERAADMSPAPGVDRSRAT
jgi:cell division septum initiation protein DivIVA